MAITYRTGVDENVGRQGAARSRRSSLASPRAIAALSSVFLVCVLVVVSVTYLRATGPISVLWGASGVAVVAWLSGPRGRDFDIAYALLVSVAFAIAGLMTGGTPQRTLMFTGACMIEVTSAVLMIRRFTPFDGAQTVGGVLKYLLVAPILAPLLSGLVVATGLSGDGRYAFGEVLISWWLGHALGLAAIGPLGLWLKRGRLFRLPSPMRLLETVALLAAVTGVGSLVFCAHLRLAGFLVVPLLFLAAARLRLPGAALALSLTICVAMIGAISTPASDLAALHITMIDKVRLLQLYLIFSGVPILPIAALLDERDQLAVAARRGQATAEAASTGKSRLLANVSHEIKSPVAGIIGIGELWSAGKLGKVTAMQQEMAEMLVRTARQVEALAYDLLDVSHAEAGTVSVSLRPVDVGSLLEDVRRTIAMRPEAADVKILVERDGEDMRALADSVRLNQVVTNLATNAVKYGRSGGLVVLRFERSRTDRVRISVSDRGPGIPIERQGELFEPFNRLGMERTTIEGNGIGLTLAKRLTELQGGTIGFESRPGEGARFWLELPAA